MREAQSTLNFGHFALALYAILCVVLVAWSSRNISISSAAWMSVAICNSLFLYGWFKLSTTKGALQNSIQELEKAIAEIKK